MENEYLTEELETAINGLKFLNHLIQRDQNQRPLERPIESLEELYAGILEFNRKVQFYNQSYDSTARRINTLIQSGDYDHPDFVSFLEQIKGRQGDRREISRRFREITGSFCFIDCFRGVDITPYIQEYRELISLNFDIGKYLDQEASQEKSRSYPRSGMCQVEETAFAEMRKKIKETGRFW